jgi:hypothetical protein
MLGIYLFESVVINNFYAISTIVMPGKANAPLVIDTHTVLALAVSLQGLQRVTRRYAQAVQFSRRMQLQQFASGNPLYVSEPAHHLAVEQSLSVSTDK